MNSNGLVRKQIRRRRYRRRPGLMRLQRRPSTFYGGKIAPLKAELGAPVYIYAATGPSYSYSFSSIADLNRISIWNINGVQYASDIVNQFNSYMFYRIKGVKLSFSRSINAAVNTVFQLPSVYFELLPDTNATANTYIFQSRWVAESDTALQVLPLNTSAAPQSKYYSFGNTCFFNNSAQHTFGKAGWTSTAIQPNIQLALGYLDVPLLSSTTESPKIGTIVATFYMEFCKRGRINNY